jgi:hypothetical protein
MNLWNYLKVFSLLILGLPENENPEDNLIVLAENRSKAKIVFLFINSLRNY